MPIVDLLEVVEVEPQEREALARVVGPELVLEALAEVEAVGDLGQRVVARQPFDLLVRLPLGGDVLLHVDPSAAGQRLVGDADDAAVAEVLDFFPAAGLLKPGDVVLDPASSPSPSRLPRRSRGACDSAGSRRTACRRGPALRAANRYRRTPCCRRPACCSPSNIERPRPMWLSAASKQALSCSSFSLRSRTAPSFPPGPILQVRNLVSRERLWSLLATRAFSPPRTEGKLERTLTYVWPSLKSPQRFSNLPER